MSAMSQWGYSAHMGSSAKGAKDDGLITSAAIILSFMHRMHTLLATSKYVHTLPESPCSGIYWSPVIHDLHRSAVVSRSFH